MCGLRCVFSCHVPHCAFRVIQEHAVFGEVAILRLLKHPNIVQLVADFDRPDALYLVMELVKVSSYLALGHRDPSRCGATTMS